MYSTEITINPLHNTFGSDPLFRVSSKTNERTNLLVQRDKINKADKIFNASCLVQRDRICKEVPQNTAKHTMALCALCTGKGGEAGQVR